jgi:hypothetical protein
MDSVRREWLAELGLVSILTRRENFRLQDQRS